MSKVTESLYQSNDVIIPYADVQHIEKYYYQDDVERREKGDYRGISIVTKHTRWDRENDYWVNNIYLEKEEADKFLRAWCYFRHELDEVNLVDDIPHYTEQAEQSREGEK